MPRVRFLPSTLLSLALLATLRGAAPPPNRSASELLLALEKLETLGSALYIAAHPDDENTEVLATLANGRKVRTAYLSITRGGGGQNLISAELDDTLAVIRTQELLAARRVDGAEQYFTAAVDFGYSKTAEESLALWGHEAVLGDVVRVIRRFRPDVILTRFSPAGGGGHGHHTASAILAVEAFKAAADPRRFPEQIQEGLQPWQATRILWNAFRFPGDNSPQAPEAATLDVGAFDPLLGKSYSELAAEARSLHRSQGFGVVAQRGSRTQSFQLLEGRPGKDLFEGISTTWDRLPGGAAVGRLLREARLAFRVERPWESLPGLLKARAALGGLAPDPWVSRKRGEIDEAIRSAAGIWMEAISDRPFAAPGEHLKIGASLILRNPVSATLLSAGPVGEPGGVSAVQALGVNRPWKGDFTVVMPPGGRPTQPYWLEGPRGVGRHAAGSPEEAGLPETPPLRTFTFRIQIGGETLSYTIPVLHRFRDPVLGERYQDAGLAPPVAVSLGRGVQVFNDGAPRALEITLQAAAPVAGTLRLALPEGWRAEPSSFPFRFAAPDEERKLSARILPPASASAADLRVMVDVGGGEIQARGRIRVDHPHLPVQTLFPEARARLVRVDLKRDGHRIGYIMGAGDEIPQCLRPLGYDVELLSDEALEGSDLSRFDAIVVGIRAFNTRPALARLQPRLLDYVARGGTEVVLYQVNAGFLNAPLATQKLGPFPFKVGRNRVTEEDSPVRFLAPGHPLLNWPNRITPADFEGWIQERSLYHAEAFEGPYAAILALGDKGEKADPGSLIVAPHGKGHFIYTGLSFFRQLPDGVPGAYRLFANLLALGSASRDGRP
ncbi:MAG: PIG-L family deacetylase [Acidobacteria bacterium]|nr:PIG-L family deacetylase [Acidobacteriota bacterium]